MTLPQEEPHPIDLGSDAIADLAAVIEQHFGVDVALSPWAPRLTDSAYTAGQQP